ncbi:MAG: helix-turn-helix domain-containing protein [Rhizobiales bacterium]|nr:helix-turn-helix domain-containing protein [Hyphomicrobiales bacterium]
MTASPLPIARFATETLPKGEGFAAWREAVAGLYEVEPPPPSGPAGFSGVATGIHLGPLVLGVMRVDALAYHRSPAKIRADGLDHFVLGLSDPGTAPSAAPTVLIQDLGQPLALPMAPLNGACIILPRDVMVRLVPGAEALHGVRVGGAMAQLLADHTWSLIRAAPALPAQQAPLFARATQQMIAACLGPARERVADARPRIEATLMVRARRHIDANLMVPGLSAAGIAAALGLSRSALYQLLAPFNGVARYIQGRRLERIHALLADPAEQRLIAEIAHDHGMTSEAHFSRAFRKRFGYAPREIRGIGLAVPVAGRPVAPGTATERLAFPVWLEQLRD